MLSILRDASLSGGEKLLFILIIAFCVFLSLSVHELSHGLVAYWMGDKTAKSSGRLSLNPLQHLDPIGAICLFLFSFGWAKPVPVNPWNFKHKKAGLILTSLGGPLSNFLLAFLAQIGIVFIEQTPSGIHSDFGYLLLSVGYILCLYLIEINLGLGIFNLIPIPPLDGSKVLNAILPQRLYFKIMEYERYGFILLLLFINLPIFSTILYTCRGWMMELFNTIIRIFIH